VSGRDPPGRAVLEPIASRVSPSRAKEIAPQRPPVPKGPKYRSSTIRPCRGRMPSGPPAPDRAAAAPHCAGVPRRSPARLTLTAAPGRFGRLTAARMIDRMRRIICAATPKNSGAVLPRDAPCPINFALRLMDERGGLERVVSALVPQKADSPAVEVRGRRAAAGHRAPGRRRGPTLSNPLTAWWRAPSPSGLCVLHRFRSISTISPSSPEADRRRSPSHRRHVERAHDALCSSNE
jgi:hypothetical protein